MKWERRIKKVKENLGREIKVNDEVFMIIGYWIEKDEDGFLVILSKPKYEVGFWKKENLDKRDTILVHSPLNGCYDYLDWWNFNECLKSS